MNMRIDTKGTGGRSDAIDWWTHVRLAAIVSAFAAIAALLLAPVLPETFIVLSVIVLATMASWYQLEGPPAAHAHVRHRRH